MYKPMVYATELLRNYIAQSEEYRGRIQRWVKENGLAGAADKLRDHLQGHIPSHFLPALEIVLDYTLQEIDYLSIVSGIVQETRNWTIHIYLQWQNYTATVDLEALLRKVGIEADCIDEFDPQTGEIYSQITKPFEKTISAEYWFRILTENEYRFVRVCETVEVTPFVTEATSDWWDNVSRYIREYVPF